MTDRSPDVTRAAERLVTTARAALRVRRAALFLRTADGQGLACVATSGAGNPDAWVGQRLRAGVGVAGRAVAEGRPVWSPDLLADPRTPLAPWLKERLEAEGLRSVLAAPLQTAAGTLGALGVLDAAGRTYTDDDITRLSTLAAESAPTLRDAFAPRP